MTSQNIKEFVVSFMNVVHTKFNENTISCLGNGNRLKNVKKTSFELSVIRYDVTNYLESWSFL